MTKGYFTKDIYSCIVYLKSPLCSLLLRHLSSSLLKEHCQGAHGCVCLCLSACLHVCVVCMYWGGARFNVCPLFPSLTPTHT